MDLKTALTNVENAVGAFLGTKAQHVALEESLRVIREALKPTNPEQGD